MTTEIGDSGTSPQKTLSQVFCTLPPPDRQNGRTDLHLPGVRRPDDNQEVPEKSGGLWVRTKDPVLGLLDGPDRDTEYTTTLGPRCSPSVDPGGGLPVRHPVLKVRSLGHTGPGSVGRHRTPASVPLPPTSLRPSVSTTSLRRIGSIPPSRL